MNAYIWHKMQENNLFSEVISGNEKHSIVYIQNILRWHSNEYACFQLLYFLLHVH